MMKRFDMTMDGPEESAAGEFVKVEDVLEALGEKKPEPLLIEIPLTIARLVCIGPDDRKIYTATLKHGEAVTFEVPVFGIKQICLELFDK